MLVQDRLTVALEHGRNADRQLRAVRPEAGGVAVGRVAGRRRGVDGARSDRKRNGRAHALQKWRRLNCRHAPRRVGRTARFPSSTPGAFIAHPGAYSVSPFTTHLVASVSRPWMRTSHCALWSRTNRAQISRLSRARTRTARKLRRRRLISGELGLHRSVVKNASPRNRASSAPLTTYRDERPPRLRPRGQVRFAAPFGPQA
jgi:hypothetical protein